jgi:hypothetical protein
MQTDQMGKKRKKKEKKVIRKFENKYANFFFFSQQATNFHTLWSTSG